ncbi:MAG TPA: hypothetical protein VJ810_23185 [Blastocatellia bacterium]|nr:hypothetical protein [Blastocatellia bacterium]
MKEARVDAVFAQYGKADSPGCALGVSKDGKLLYARGFGMANLEHNIPNGPKAVISVTQFEYSRDAAGKLSGFAIYAGRIRNVRFSR